MGAGGGIRALIQIDFNGVDDSFVGDVPDCADVDMLLRVCVHSSYVLIPSAL